MLSKRILEKGSCIGIALAMNWSELHCSWTICKQRCMERNIQEEEIKEIQEGGGDLFDCSRA